MLNHPYPSICFQPICCTFKSYLSGRARPIKCPTGRRDLNTDLWISDPHGTCDPCCVFISVVFPIICGTNARSQDLGGLATITCRFCWSCATALLRSPTWRNSRSLSKDSWDAGDWKAGCHGWWAKRVGLHYTSQARLVQWTIFGQFRQGCWFQPREHMAVSLIPVDS